MNPSTTADFDQHYQTHLKHLKLKGLQPKTIDAYSRTIRRMGDYFDFQIDNLSPAQLTDYFSDLVTTHSWSAVKLDLYGFKFYTQHVLGKPWCWLCAIRGGASENRLATVLQADHGYQRSKIRHTSGMTEKHPTQNSRSLGATLGTDENRLFIQPR